MLEVSHPDVAQPVERIEHISYRSLAELAEYLSLRIETLAIQTEDDRERKKLRLYSDVALKIATCLGDGYGGRNV